MIFFVFLAGCLSKSDKKYPAKTHSEPPPPVEGEVTDVPNPKLKICSFNIQFLGSFKFRQNESLAQFLRDEGCNGVAIQELVAPPDLNSLESSEYFQKPEVPTFPDGKPFRPKELVTLFFEAMYDVGYDKFWLSESDTGTSPKNNNNGSATEWWVFFYESQVLKPRLDLPHGFIADDVTKNPQFDRVPYAFSFQTVQGDFDFVIINAHLHPGAYTKSKMRRFEELSGIYEWIDDQMKINDEADYIVLGDMNIENEKELLDIVQTFGFISFNFNAEQMTNTNINGPKPYDHIFINDNFTSDVEVDYGMEVHDLIEGMMRYWEEEDLGNGVSLYPGKDPYLHNIFRQMFSDHHPVSFTISNDFVDDD